VNTVNTITEHHFAAPCACCLGLELLRQWRCIAGLLKGTNIDSRCLQNQPCPSLLISTFFNEPSSTPVTDESPRVFGHLSHDPQGHLEETVRAPFCPVLCCSHHLVQL